MSCAEIELKLFEKFTQNLEPLINKLIESKNNSKPLKILTDDSIIYWAKLSQNSNLESLRKSENIELEVFAIGKIDITTFKINSKNYKTFDSTKVIINKKHIINIY